MEPLLTPYHIGTCQLPNRFVMTAASLCRSPGGKITDDVLDFYAARARGGAGLLIAGAAGIDPVRRSSGGMMQICDDSFIPKLQRLTTAVHQENGKVFLQLLHPGAYANPAEHGDLPPIAPSSYRSGLTRAQTVEMTLEDIHTVTGYFADAAARTVTAGFDGLELCASVGYLLAEFLSSATNQRTDQYGGNLQNRMRFLLEIVDAVKATAGSDYPLMVRLSGQDYIPGGNELADTIQIAEALEQHGVNAISVTGGWHESRVPQITGHVPHGGYVHLARGIRQHVSIPVVACNRMDVASGREALENGSCDLVGMCRPFLADPNLVQKLKQGRESEIHRCLSCNQECLDRVFAGKSVGCTINPAIGRELSPTSCLDNGKRILVVGAGISGLTYGALAARENNVTIVEQADRCGGASHLLSTLPAWANCAAYLEALYQECIRAQVTFQFGRSVTASELEHLLETKQYDKIVIAAGALSAEPSLPIAEKTTVHPLSAFAQSSQTPTGNVVIIGNDFRALEFALSCSEAQSVTCIGPLRKPGSGMAKSVLWVALQEAKKQNIRCISEATVTAVTIDGVHYTQNGTEALCPADTVIWAQGWKAAPLLQPAVFSPALLSHITWIGDAKAPGRIPEAVRTAVSAAQRNPSEITTDH